MSDTHCKIRETLLIKDLKPSLNENVSSKKLYLFRYHALLRLRCKFRSPPNMLGVSSTGTAPLTRELQDSDKALILSSFNYWRQHKRLQLSFLQQLITLY